MDLTAMDDYQVSINVLPDLAMILDNHYRVVCINRSMSDRLEISSKDAMGRSCYQLFLCGDEPPEICPHAKLLADGKEHSAEIYQENLDGFFMVSVSPLRNAEGRLIGSVHVARDITAHKKMEEALLKSRESYRSLVESTDDSIYLMDRNCAYLFINKKHLSRLGFSRDKVIGRTYSEFHSENDTKELVERVEKVFITGQSIVYEHKSRRDGRYFLRTLNPVKASNGRTVSVTMVSKDISEQKQTEEDLSRFNEELFKSHNQRKFLSRKLIDLLENDRRETAMELHDHIGQTLTSLKMGLEMIHDQLKSDNPQLKSRIKDNADKATLIIKDVKTISRGLMPGMLDVLGLVASLRELFSEVERNTDLEIEFFGKTVRERFAPEKELAVYRIAQEALTNIVKYARAKRVFVNLAKKENLLSLSMEDDGIGFDKELEMKTSGNKGPLGLLIMRERAVQLDGELSVESRIGKGTHLLVEIPL